MVEITLDRLEQLPEDAYVLIDVRDESAREYGMMPGAITISMDGQQWVM